MPKYDEFDLDLQSIKVGNGDDVINNITAPSITCPPTGDDSQALCCM